MQEHSPLYPTSHKSVLVEEVLHYLDIKPGNTYLDVTFGSGGHTRAILEREPGCKVVALDWDTRSIETFGPALQEEFGDRLTIVWGNFALLYKILKTEKIGPIHGILADFGTSQMQISERPGFSLYKDKALDMRMSPSYQKVTARDILSQADAQTLQEIFSDYGEERYARKIAQAIVHARGQRQLTTTKQLADLVERTVPRQPRVEGRRAPIHPATRIFQALRIYVNRELDNIQAFLPVALSCLQDQGRLVCISFHSLEDRIVKTFFKEREDAGEVEILTKKVVSATDDELRANPSSRSAKLRAAQKIKKDLA